MNDKQIMELLLKTIYDGKGEKDAIKGMGNVKNAANETNNAAKQTGSSFAAMFKSFSKVAVVATAISQLTSKVVEATKKSSDYIETLNLLDAAFDNNTEGIKKFANSFAETLNLDDKTLLDAAAHFKVLSQSMGIATETGEEFSKLLTQMTLDVSSLYNMDFKKAQTALQYAVEGRGTSLKQRTGVSVLETSVQTTLDTLGVDAYVEDMNDAEKAIARLISMEYQLRTSQGDLARTIEAPANQFRVLGEQVALVGRNIGNIFLPAMAAILPVVNAVLIVINKLLSALAKLVGYDPAKFDYFTDTDAIDYFDDLGGAVGAVGSAADTTRKKLLGLRGFDQLNVIKSPTESPRGGGGGGGSGAGGINQNLLDAFDKMFAGYDSMLDGVETKATKISKAIMNELKSFDTSNAVIAFENLYDAIKPVAQFRFDDLKNLYTEFLKPLANYTISEVIPTFINGLADIMRSVNWDKITNGLKDLYGSLAKFTKATIEPLLYFYDNFLVPLVKQVLKSDAFTGLIDFVTGLTDILTVIIKIDTKKFKVIIDVLKELIPILMPTVTLIGLIGPEVKKLGKSLNESFDKLEEAERGYSNETDENFKRISKIWENAQKDLEKVSILPNTVIDDAYIAKATKHVQKLCDEIKKTLNKNKEEELGIISEMVSKGVFSEEESATLIKNVNEHYGGIEKSTDKAQKRITEILESAKNNNGVLTKDMVKELTEQYNILNGNTVDIITQDANEQEIIRTKLKNRTTEISKEQASSLIKDALNTRDNSIKAANEQYDKTLREAQTLKKTSGLSKEQYNAMIKYAEETRDKSIKAANEQYDETFDTFQRENEDIANEIDRSTGEVKGKWQLFCEEIGKYFATKWEEAKKFWNEHIAKFFTKEYWTGLWNDVIQIIAQKLTDLWDGIKKWYNDHIGKYLKKDYWKEKVTNAFNGIVDAIGGIKTAIQNKWNEIWNNLTAKIKTPHITWTSGKKATGWIKDTLEALHLPTSLPKLNIEWYAKGGMPDMGQLFIANERGPELVGQIGGKSFVANQNQMMDLIDKKLANAGGMNNATFVIQVGDETIAKKVLNDLNGMAKNDGKPIVIRGV